MTNQPVTRRTALEGVAAVAALAAVRPAIGQQRHPSGSADELTKLTIDEAGKRIAARELSPVELTRAYLARIEQVQPKVNAYITVLADQAIAQARALEAEIMAGKNRGPLHGIPLGLKDNIDTAGIKTTAASAVYADRVPTEDAPVVTKLRDAGAVFLGKLNMHEFAYGGTSAVTHYGPVHNPWNLKRAPGGSSGGSAAAVAARMCAAALGTDTAASVRYPASCCGVVGLKATHGLASIRGIVPLSEMHDHVGPLSKTVADSATVLTALAGFDPLDPVSIAAPKESYHDAIGASVKSLRLGVPREPFFADLDPEIAAAVEEAIRVLRGLTSGVAADAAVPPVNSGPVLNAEIYAYHEKLVADPDKRKLYDPITLGRIEGGRDTSATAYFASRRQMVIARNTSDNLFKDVDVLVTPTMPTIPAEIEAALKDAPNEISLIRNTLPFDVYALPTISVPCGFTKAGMPIGLQISGPRLAEARVLAIAHAYERATQWHKRETPLEDCPHFRRRAHGVARRRTKMGTVPLRCGAARAQGQSPFSLGDVPRTGRLRKWGQSLQASARPQGREDCLVDALAVEVDDFDAPPIHDQHLAGQRDAAELAQDEAGQRRELRAHRQAAGAELALELVDLDLRVGEPRAVLAAHELRAGRGAVDPSTID
jgi:aspartyl-tRNA(Asn)/glutamyl-tRNA(Gln) amidotransferase subunit A